MAAPTPTQSAVQTEQLAGFLRFMRLMSASDTPAAFTAATMARVGGKDEAARSDLLDDISYHQRAQVSNVGSGSKRTSASLCRNVRFALESRHPGADLLLSAVCQKGLFDEEEPGATLREAVAPIVSRVRDITSRFCKLADQGSYYVWISHAHSLVAGITKLQLRYQAIGAPIPHPVIQLKRASHPARDALIFWTGGRGNFPGHTALSNWRATASR